MLTLRWCALKLRIIDHAITVAVAALAGLTLVPALLGFARERIDRLHVRRPVAEPANPHSPLHTYTRIVAAHPWRFAISGIARLLIIAIPMLSMRLGHVGLGSEPTSYSERQAYDAVSHGFGAGTNGPLTIVAQLPAGTTSQQRASLESSLRQTLETTSDIESVSSFTASKDDALLIGKVISDSGPTSIATQNLVAQLQDVVLPKALAGAHATGYVTGTTAATIDFENTVSSRLVIVPALMFLFDKANWWTPRWLDRILPRLDPEPATPTAQQGPYPPTIDDNRTHAEPRAP